MEPLPFDSRGLFGCRTCGALLQPPTEQHKHVHTYRYRNEESIPSCLIDVLTTEACVDPVERLFNCPHTFSGNDGIREYIESNGKCPTCRTRAGTHHLHPVDLLTREAFNNLQVV